jgi:stearoyl-CoA desaturase (delta-9 desaturase)
MARSPTRGARALYSRTRRDTLDLVFRIAAYDHGVEAGENVPGATPGCPPEATQPVENETAARIITGLLTAIPFLLLGLAAWQTWSDQLHWSDLVVFATIYLATGLGVTVGFHRLFAHRSFSTSRALRAILAILGSAAIEGPVIAWVADHRRHHAFSDREGDPHSPHVGFEGGWRGILGGLYHAHLGWLFIHTHRGSKRRFAPDLIKDPAVRFVDRTFFAWAALGLAIPFGLGVAIGDSVATGLTALLWGGAVRVFVVHHVTYSVNSLCHMFGRQRFTTKDQSRNLAPLALLTLGEAWHNNHHAFPTSAAHGLGRWELDPSGLVIRALERVGLVWDVVRISPRRQAAKAIA